MIEQLALFVLAVVAFAIVGILIGMLIAPRLGRMIEPKDEDAGDGTD